MGIRFSSYNITNYNLYRETAKAEFGREIHFLGLVGCPGDKTMWVARNPCMIEELSINYNKLARCRISLHGREIMLWNERWIGNLWLHQKVKCYISLLGGRGTIKAGGIDVENTRVNVVNSTIISTKIPASRQSEAFIWWAGGWGIIIIIILLQPPPLALRYVEKSRQELKYFESRLKLL